MNTEPKPTAEPRRSVVIVDDEKSYVDLMAQMIADNMDCPVHGFTRPAEALAHLAEVAATVVVTDYFMPGMDGVEFIRRAAPVVPGAVFIMISGHDLDPIKRDLEGLDRLKLRLQKPFGWRPLAEAVIRVWPGTDTPDYRS